MARWSETAIAFAHLCLCGFETTVAFVAKMGVFGAFFGRRGVVGFSGALFGVSSGVVGFIVAMFLRAAREKVRPAWLVGGDSGTKFALLGQNLPNWAFLGEQGEFCTARAVRRGVLGEFCTGSGAVRLVQGLGRHLSG